MKTVNLEEILDLKLIKMIGSNPNVFHSLDKLKKEPEYAIMIDAMREACNQAIYLCAENAKFLNTSDSTYVNLATDKIIKTKKQII